MMNELYSDLRQERSRSKAWPFALFLAFALSAAILSSSALAGYDLTDAEWAILPEYCHHQGNVSRNHSATGDAAAWRRRLGDDYEPIHHWCVVYVWMGRAYKAGVYSDEGKRMLSAAEADIDYFVKRMARNSPRAAEVYTRLGEVYLLQKKPKLAEAAFTRAHAIDRTRWQAYLLWGNYLYRIGRVGDARKEVLEGLKYAPTNKALQSLASELASGKEDDGR